MLSKTSLSIAAAGAGLCFLGYCIYFDKKRRSDPNFKEKLRQRRRKTKNTGGSKAETSNTQFPDIHNAEAMQKFFFQEVQLGEELMATGEIESGIEHLSNAVAVCGQPQQLLQVLQQTLPPQVFKLLIQALPSATKRLSGAAAAGQAEMGGPTVKTLEEDDVE